MNRGDRGETAQSQTRRRGRQRQAPPIPVSIWGRIPTWAYFVAAGAVILGLAIGLPTYLSQRHRAPSASPRDVVAIGGAAPGFTLNDPYGQSHTLAPGDGKAHLLLFYMGYF